MKKTDSISNYSNKISVFMLANEITQRKKEEKERIVGCYCRREASILRVSLAKMIHSA